MKIKMERLVASSAAFRKFYNADLTLHTAYVVRKVVNAAQEELNFFNEERGKIMARYHIGEDGEDREACDMALTDLLHMEVEVNCEPVKLPMDEAVHLSAGDLDALDPIITFDNAEEANA